MINIKKLILLSIILVFNWSCSHETPIELGNGYQFLPTNTYNHYITHGIKTIVDTNIVEYEVVGHYIVGLRKPSEWLDIPEDLVSTNYGYFALNMETGVLREGLDKSEIDAIKMYKIGK